MTFDIQKIRATINQYGAARNAHYRAQIFPPASLNMPIIRDLEFFCENAQLPGVGIQTEPVKHLGYGLQEERPTQVNFDEMQLVFLGDGRGKILKFFHAWANKISNFDFKNKKNSETFAYPTDYWGNITINVYDRSGQEIYIYHLEKCFPKIIGSVQMGWEQIDTIMRIPITFSFRSWSHENVNYGHPNAFDQNTYNKRLINNDIIDPYIVNRKIVETSNIIG